MSGVAEGGTLAALFVGGLGGAALTGVELADLTALGLSASDIGLGAGGAFYGAPGSGFSGFTTEGSYNQAITNGSQVNTQGGNAAASQQQIYNDTYQSVLQGGGTPEQASQYAQYAAQNGVNFSPGAAGTASNLSGLGSATAPGAGTTIGQGVTATAPALSTAGSTAQGLGSGIGGAMGAGLAGGAAGAGLGLMMGQGGGTTGTGAGSVASSSSGLTMGSGGGMTGQAGANTIANGATGGLGGITAGQLLSGGLGLGSIAAGLTGAGSSGGLSTQAPNPGTTAGQILGAELQYAPSIYGATAQYAPQYSQLQNQMLSSGVGSMLGNYGAAAPALQGLQTGLNAQQAQGNMSLLQSMGPQFVQSYLAANPQLQQTQASLNALANGGIGTEGQGAGIQMMDNKTLDQLNTTAQQQLAMGTSVSQQEQATVANQVLSNYSSMGRSNDPSAIAGLALGEDSYGQQLLTQREGNAATAAGLTTQQNTANQQAQGMNLQAQLNALNSAGALSLASSAPAYAQLFQQSQGLTNAYNTTGQAGTSLQNAQGLSGMYNPFNSAAYGSAYNAQTQANQQNANTNAGLLSGGLGLLGSAFGSSSSLSSLLGSFCWVAREVYGEDNPMWVKARTWMLTKAPEGLFRYYINYGEGIAEKLRTDPVMKARIRGHFDTILAEAN